MTEYVEELVLKADSVPVPLAVTLPLVVCVTVAEAVAVIDGVPVGLVPEVLVRVPVPDCEAVGVGVKVVDGFDVTEPVFEAVPVTDRVPLLLAVFV